MIKCTGCGAEMKYGNRVDLCVTCRFTKCGHEGCDTKVERREKKLVYCSRHDEKKKVARKAINQVVPEDSENREIDKILGVE